MFSIKTGRKIGLVACVFVLGGTTGCKKLTKMLGEKAAEQVAEVGAALPGTPSGEEQTMGLYAQGYNVLIDDPQECLSEYFDDVPLEGPQDGKKYRFFPAHTRGTLEVGKAKESFGQANKAAPDSLKHLQPLGEAALSNLEQACSTFAEVHKYYDAEDFKDDEGKKGKELHEKMVKIAKATEGSLKKLEVALSEIEERQTKKELAQFESEKGYSYWFRLYGFEAKKLLGVTDPKEFEKRFAALDKAHEGLAAFSKSKGEGNAAFKGFVGQADRFHSTAKKLSRAMAEEKPKPRELESLRSQLTSSFNSVVSVSNSLRQLEANDLLK